MEKIELNVNEFGESLTSFSINLMDQNEMMSNIFIDLDENYLIEVRFSVERSFHLLCKIEELPYLIWNLNFDRAKSIVILDLEKVPIVEITFVNS